MVKYNKQPVCQWALLYLWTYKMQRQESLLYSLLPTSNISYRKATWIIFDIKRKGHTSSFEFCVPLLHDLCHSELFLNRVKLAPSSCSRLNRQNHSEEENDWSFEYYHPLEPVQSVKKQKSTENTSLIWTCSVCLTIESLRRKLLIQHFLLNPFNRSISARLSRSISTNFQLLKQVTLVATIRLTLGWIRSILIYFFLLDSVLKSIPEQAGMHKSLCIICRRRSFVKRPFKFSV